VPEPTDEELRAILDRDKELSISSATYGVSIHFCDSRETYIKCVREKKICFSMEETALLVAEHPRKELIVEALEAKRLHPGIKITSFKERTCLHPTKGESITY